MKMLRILLLSLFCLSASVASADLRGLVKLHLTEVEKNKTWTLDVEFDKRSYSNFTAFQMDLNIPESMEYVDDSFEMSNRLLGFSGSINSTPDSALRVVVYSFSNAEIPESHGKLFSVTLKAKHEMKEGIYDFVANNICFARRDGYEDKVVDAKYALRYSPNGVFTKYKVTYILEGKVYKEYELEWGERLPLVSVEPREGYTFAGWKNRPSVMPMNDVVVTGEFRVNHYVITYYLDGRKFGSQTLAYGEKIVPLEVPLNGTEKFMGWQNLPEVMPASNLNIFGTIDPTGIEQMESTTLVDVYTLQGINVLSGVTYQAARAQLPKGIYVVKGHVVYLK